MFSQYAIKPKLPAGKLDRDVVTLVCCETNGIVHAGRLTEFEMAEAVATGFVSIALLRDRADVLHSEVATEDTVVVIVVAFLLELLP